MLRAPLPLLLAAWIVSSGYALADDGLTPDQKRMRSCNTQAKEKELSGAQRSRFITSCLNGKPEVRKLTAHQQKNESCTRQADERKLDGADKEKFVAGCLDGSAVVGG